VAEAPQKTGREKLNARKLNPEGGRASGIKTAAGSRSFSAAKSRNPMEVKITRIGTSAGIILPKAALERLHAEKGQKLFLTEVPGGLRISRFNPEFKRQMRYAYEAMDLFPDALKELAK